MQTNNGHCQVPARDHCTVRTGENVNLQQISQLETQS